MPCYGEADPREGVCFAKKDYNLEKLPDIDVPNLQVIKLMQSFKSKEYVRETFAWMHYYWYLTNEGIEFLRTYLNLPSEIVHATLKNQAKPIGRPFGGPPCDRPRIHDFQRLLRCHWCQQEASASELNKACYGVASLHICIEVLKDVEKRQI